MKIVNADAKNFDVTNMHPYKIIERIGRICYKSEDAITDDSAVRFVTRMCENKHYAMLEHARAIFLFSDMLANKLVSALTTAMITSSNDDIGYFIRYISITRTNDQTIVSGSFRTWIELSEYAETHRDFKAITQYVNAALSAYYPELFPASDTLLTDEVELITREDLIDIIRHTTETAPTLADTIADNHLQHTILFTCDRGVSHELVRHRPASFAQESTRYCNYSKDKFGNNITVIKPCFFDEDSAEYKLWYDACINAENAYFDLLALNAAPQQARDVLPTSTKTEIAVTALEREWRHIINLRYRGLTGAPHPQMREIMQIAYPYLVSESDTRLSIEHIGALEDADTTLRQILS